MSSSISLRIQALREKFEKGEVASAFSNIKAMAVTSLKVLDYQKINRLIDEYRDLLIDYLKCKPLKLAILGGFTTQPIAMTLRTLLLAEGCLTDIYESEYNSYKMEVLNTESDLYYFKPDIVLFATGSKNIVTFPDIGSSSDHVESAIDAFIEEYRNLWSIVENHSGAVIIQQNFELLEENILGRLEDKYFWSRSCFIQKINDRLWELDGKGIYILNVYGLSVRIGVYNWYEPRLYHHSKHGFNPNMSFEYGRLFIGLYRAITGKVKKCLVIDLDNTIWGGIVGDDGIHGIQLGNVSSEGEAYTVFCNYLKELKKKGVILAVNSKNDKIVAEEVFTKHPEMPLELDDFAAFYCNWESKSSNIEKIIDELNIGADAVVFIDDNPVECEEVRNVVAEVEVIEMNGDPAYFIRKLDQLHLFDQLDITNEDFKRSESYIAQRKIREIRQASLSLEDFLNGLEMEGRVCYGTSKDIPRIEQMFKKTNQFNLTSRKYDNREILQYTENKDKFCLVCWLKDKYIQYGLVSVVAGDISEDNLEIDNWVMSCRVFSRTFEQFIFNWITKFAKLRDCTAIYSDFIPTSRNGYAKGLLPNLGFKRKDNTDFQQWIYDLSNHTEVECFIRPQSDELWS